MSATDHCNVCGGDATDHHLCVETESLLGGDVWVYDDGFARVVPRFSESERLADIALAPNEVEAIVSTLQRDDCFRVDSHGKTLRVHRAVEFVGNVVLVAYDETGAKWSVLEEDGEYFIGMMESRRKQFSEMRVISRAR